MKEIKAYIRNQMVDGVIDALSSLPNAPGVTTVAVHGYGRPAGAGPSQLVERTKLEIVAPDSQVEQIIHCIVQNARTETGHRGDGKIFVSPVHTAIRIRNGEHGESVV